MYMKILLNIQSIYILKSNWILELLLFKLKKYLYRKSGVVVKCD